LRLKATRILLGLALLGLAASVATADAVDPTVIIRKVDPPPIAITSPNQTFNLFANTSHNIFAFQNDTGITLTALTLDLFGQNAELLFSCGDFAGGDIFSTCSSTAGNNGDTILSFFGVGNGFTGITPATCSIDDKGIGDGLHAPFDNNSDDKTVCVDGVFSLEFGGIPRGAIVGGTGTFATPEPMTAVMLLGGLAGLAGLQKRRKS
jgi:hypothetical protein